MHATTRNGALYDPQPLSSYPQQLDTPHRDYPPIYLIGTTTILSNTSSLADTINDLKLAGAHWDLDNARISFNRLLQDKCRAAAGDNTYYRKLRTCIS